MKMRKFVSLALVALSMTSCWVASIWTEAPVTETRTVVVHDPTPPPTYTTTVVTSAPKVTTVTTFVATNYNTDPCFYLDLNAVAAAFAESRNAREFEQILNSSRYMINNLDLNHDGWVDYLRVIETRQGYYHAYLIQACLAPSVFQDVATLIAERRPDALYVEVIGDRYLYGYNYIVRPVFVKRPPMWDAYGRSTYEVWVSPYHYGYFPSYYSQPKPVYLSHYQTYVNTYMTNHHYCHHCDYPQQPHYSGYTDMTRQYSRNDYQTQHPDNSFERRVTNSANRSGVTIRNAAQLRTEVDRSSRSSSPTTSTTSTSSTTGRTSSTTTTTAPTTTRQSGTTTKSGTTTTTRTSSTSGQSRPTAQPNTTTVSTRVSTSGTTRTTVTTTDNTGRSQTVRREGTSTSRTSSSSGSTTKSAQDKTSESSPRSGRRGR